MKSTVAQIAVAMLGAALQEFVYWYDMRSKLDAAKYQRMMHSKVYWFITVGMMWLSGFGTWAWYAGEAQSPRAYLIAGAALPLLLKKAVSAVGAREVTLGPEVDTSPIRDYFYIA